jgi:hypothetical protein
MHAPFLFTFTSSYLGPSALISGAQSRNGLVVWAGSGVTQTSTITINFSQDFPAVPVITLKVANTSLADQVFIFNLQSVSSKQFTFSLRSGNNQLPTTNVLVAWTARASGTHMLIFRR